MPVISDETQAAIVRAADLIAASQRRDGLLLLAGNGGSFADALHIGGELAKDFERARPLPEPLRTRLAEVSGAEELGACLQRGLRVVVLGANGALSSAIDNDFTFRHAGLAQELCSLARADDVLLAISTSGRSPNVLNACYVARALDVRVIALTGLGPNPLGDVADVSIRASGATTAEIQAHHVACYHQLCRLVEHDLFPS